MIEENTGDIQRSIGRLEGKLDSVLGVVSKLSVDFTALEQGRLSRLEVAFNTLETETNVKTTASARWTAAIMSIGVSVIAAVISYIALHWR